MKIKWSKKAVEAAARAICWKNGMNPDLSLNGDKENWLWHEYIEQAKASLEAGAKSQKSFEENPKKPEVDMTMLLAWESGYEEAILEAAKIARNNLDKYDTDDPYCNGICDASSGIALRITELLK